MTKKVRRVNAGDRRPSGREEAAQRDAGRPRDLEKGDVIFAHDPDTFKAHKHSPEFYQSSAPDWESSCAGPFHA
jgi:hypothetical protein